MFVASMLTMIVPITVEAKPGGNPTQQGCDSRNNNTHEKLLECVRGSEVKQHLQALQAIASANNGTRAEQTPGFAASVEYVRTTMEAAGWDVKVVPFDYQASEDTLQQLSPISAEYPTGGFTNTGAGDVTAAVTPVDINLAQPGPSTSGCEAGDFAGFPVGNIALIQCGTCTFADKAANAIAAGAAAVIIFNQGNTPDREGLIVGTLAPFVATVPVVGASFAQGVSLAQPGRPPARACVSSR